MLGRNRVNSILFLGTSFLLGVGAGLVINAKDWTGFVSSYIPALATLVAAFYGAKFAFQFQSNKELIDEKKQRIVSANSAIFTLSRMANDLFNYQRDFINPVRNNKGAFIELRPTLHLEKEHIKLNIESLYFILQLEDRNLLGEIINVEEQYKLAIEIINQRSKIHIEEVQPIMEKAGFLSGNTNIVSAMEIEKILGNRIYSTILEISNDVIFNVDNTIESLKTVATKLKTCIKHTYPNEVIISFVLPEDS